MGRSCRHYELGVGIPFLSLHRYCSTVRCKRQRLPRVKPRDRRCHPWHLTRPRPATSVSTPPAAMAVVTVVVVEVPTRTDEDSDSRMVAVAMVRPAPPAAVAIAMLDIDLSAGRNRGAEDGRGGQSKEEFPHAMLPSVCLLGVNASARASLRQFFSRIGGTAITIPTKLRKAALNPLKTIVWR